MTESHKDRDRLEAETIYDSYATAAKYHPAFRLKSFEMTRHHLARSSEFNRDFMVRDALNAARIILKQCARAMRGGFR